MRNHRVVAAKVVVADIEVMVVVGLKKVAGKHLAVQRESLEAAKEAVPGPVGARQSETMGVVGLA